MDKKVKIIIIGMSMLIVVLVTFIIVDRAISKIADSQEPNSLVVSQKNETKKEQSTQKDNTNEIVEKDEKEADKTTKQTKEEEPKKEAKQEENKKAEDKAVTAVKNALKDKKWLEQNIYMQESEKRYDEKSDDQVVNFLVCKKSDKPIVIITVASEKMLYKKVLVVSYNGEKVTCQKINEGHLYHGEFYADANKYMVCSDYGTKGYITQTYQSVKDGNIEFIGEYGTFVGYDSETGDEAVKYYINNKEYRSSTDEVSKEEYEKYKAELNKETYNFVQITTELTDSNIDRYIR